MNRVSFIFSLVIPLAFACGGSGGVDLEPVLDYNDPEACNPLGTVNCLMPWPSAVYLDEDPTTATGYRLNIPSGALPQNIDGIRVDENLLSRFDGFGPASYLLVGFEGGVSEAGLPDLNNIQDSLAADAPIALLNMETGERVPYFAEVDYTTDKPEDRALMIRPMARMAPGTRHAVAVTKAVRGPGGAELSVPPGFQALVDGTNFKHPLWDKVAPRYDEIFPALEAAGYAKDDLLLAWDFVTASDEFMTRDMLTMRDLGVSWLENNTQTVDLQDRNPRDETVIRSLIGSYTAPNFLSAREDDPSIILRDEAGLPSLDGTYDANFAAIIPACVDEVALPIPVVLFGHGIYGTAEGYLDERLAGQIADDLCVVIVATDWIGLSERQIALTALTANEFSRGPWVVEKLGQAVINFIGLEYLVRNVLATRPEFQREGQPIIDTDEVQYFGASLGGIMGEVFMAFDPNIRRGALGVPGGPWSLLFERSMAWSPIQIAAFGAYENQYVYQSLVAIWGTLFEQFDPITFAGRVINDPMPNTPAKQIFLYETLNDGFVHNVSTEFMARELGVKVAGPSVRMPWGMEEGVGMLTSGLAIYDEGADPVPDTNEGPIRDNGTHSDVHERPAVLRQLQHFLSTGEVRSECYLGETLAACDCTTGACD